MSQDPARSSSERWTLGNFDNASQITINKLEAAKIQ
jgi:hypothetical protein